MAEFTGQDSTDVQREVNQDSQLQNLQSRVILLEERLKNVTEALNILLTRQATDAVNAAASLKLYQAEVVTDKSEVTDKTILCTRTETGIELTSGKSKLELAKMAPPARRAMEEAFAEMPSAPSFYVNLYSLD